MELCNACERGDYDQVAYLLQKSDLTAINRLVGKHRVQRTALHHAAEYGHLNIVKELVSFGSNVDIVSSDLRLPLHDACIGGTKEVVEYLAGVTTDVNLADMKGQTALHVACYHGETHCIDILVKQGCDLLKRDKAMHTCLDVAFITDQVDVIRFLFGINNELFSIPNPVSGQYIVHVGAMYGAKSSILFLMKNNIAVDVPDNKGLLPCHIAAVHGKLSILKLLLLKDKSMFHVTDNQNRNVGHYACLSGDLLCVHWLLSNGLDVTCLDESGNSITHYSGSAAAANCAELVNCLANHGAPFDLKNKNGELPITVARKEGRPIAFEKGLSGKSQCHLCIGEKNEKNKYKPSTFNKNIADQKSMLFDTSKLKNSSPTEMNSSKGAEPVIMRSRNMAAKYYGGGNV